MAPKRVLHGEEYPYPFILGWGTTPPNVVYKRLQIHNSDIDPALNAGAVYFGEGQYVCTDEPYNARYNNVSYRGVIVGSPTSSSWSLAFTGTTSQQYAAITAWRLSDPAVTLATIGPPDDGEFILGYKATDLGGGQWHYEYAVYNMNCDRAARAFTVPVPEGVNVTNVGFHDVDYHSGEPYSGVDWFRIGDTWGTETFAANPNANALRWGTLYNFRFDANAPPTPTTATIELFKPGIPSSVSVNVVGPSLFIGDADGDGDIDADDLDAVITQWGDCPAPPAPCPGDVNHDGVVDVDDLLAVIHNWAP